MKRLPVGGARLAIGFLVWVLVMLLLFGDRLFEESATGGVRGAWDRISTHPVYLALTAPFLPWAKAVTADGLATFLPWCLLALALWFLAFELTVRIPVDFRTLSLETSADVARRLARMRSGRNMISGGSVSKRTLGWRVPWLFGRGPFGAIAWLKLCAIVRKSRGTLLFSAFVLSFITLLTTSSAVGELADPLIGSVLIALLGTMYLASGLRFDFRADLDLMEIIKAWPASPARIFLATILPSAALVSALIGGAIGVRALILESFPPVLWIVTSFVPVAVLMWIAVDNAVFLLMPVRFVPGQGSAVHHTGRTMVLVFIRMSLLAVITALTAGTYALASAGLRALDATPSAALAGGLVGAALVALVWIAALVQFGGWTLKRFDVARERSASL